MSDSNLMDSKEAAAFLRLSMSALYSLRTKHGLPFVKLGKKVLFSKESLLAYIAKHEQSV